MHTSLPCIFHIDVYQVMYICMLNKNISATTIAHSYVKLRYIIPPNINEDLARYISFQCMYIALGSILSTLVTQRRLQILFLTCNTMVLSDDM